MVNSGALINEIRNSPLIGTCPDCERVFSTRKARLLDCREPIPKSLETAFLKRETSLRAAIQRLQSKLKQAEKKAKSKEAELKALNLKFKKMPYDIRVVTRKTTYGQVLEKIFPSTRGFKMNLSDCRAVFKPIDYLSFNGHSKNGVIEEIAFLEIKTGEKGLDKKQRSIKEAVEAGRLKIETYKTK